MKKKRIRNGNFCVSNPSPIAVKKIWWEHIYLHMEVSGENLRDYDYYVGKVTGERYPLEVDGNEIVMNVVNIPSLKLLPSGKWLLICVNKTTQQADPLRILPECGYGLDALDKVYRYCAGHYAYVVTFGIRNGGGLTREMNEYPEKPPVIVYGDEEMFLYINASYMKENKKQAKRDVFAETTGMKSHLRGIMIRSSKRIYNTIYRIMCRIQKRDGKHILLMSETRTPIGGNLKALDDRLKERGLDKEYTISYSFSKTLEDGMIRQAKTWFRLLFLIARQDYIFVDDYVPIFQTVDLIESTKLIQLWHAGVGFKSVGYSRFGKTGSPHATDSCHRRYDYAIVGARGLIPVYEEVFGIPKDHILPYGLPRLDGYMVPEKAEAFRKEFYEKYPQLKERKIILFAPTFRGNGQKTAYYPWDKVNFAAAYEMCGDEYAFVIKMHPFVREIPEIPQEYRDRIYDFSKGTDINELFYVTEILITDFSSNIYEFSLQNKPMIFYAFDKDFYQLTRGVHRRLEEFAPGKICMTFDEVLDTIQNQDFEEERRRVFIENSFDRTDGYASDRIIDEIILGKK